jgi:hypothetical protein
MSVYTYITVPVTPVYTYITFEVMSVYTAIGARVAPWSRSPS